MPPLLWFAIHEIQWSVQQQNSASSTLSQWQNETISGHRRPKFDLGGLKRLEATFVKDLALAVNIVKVKWITRNMTDFQAHHTCQFQAAQVWNRFSVEVTPCKVTETQTNGTNPKINLKRGYYTFVLLFRSIFWACMRFSPGGQTFGQNEANTWYLQALACFPTLLNEHMNFGFVEPFPM